MTDQPSDTRPTGARLGDALRADEVLPGEVLPGERLDAAVTRLVPGISRRDAQALIERGGVRSATGRTLRAKGLRAEAALPVTITLDALDDRPEAERARLRRLCAEVGVEHQGDGFVIARKPSGLGSTARHFGDSLFLGPAVAALTGLSLAGLDDFGLVHRLDVGTSGACLFATTAAALQAAVADRQAGRLTRQYLAVVSSDGLEDGGVIEAPIAHHPTLSDRMLAGAEAQRIGRDLQTAETRFEVVSRAAGRALLRVAITGGRRHQIRVHLASRGFPLFGDTTYGGPAAPRLALHAESIEWNGMRYRVEEDTSFAGLHTSG